MTRLSIVRTLILILIAGAVVGIGRFAYESAQGAGAGYSAVLLTTGDIYFAKVVGEQGHYTMLRDIYYPQVAQNADGTQAQDVQIVKFGNELHGPKDEIRVNRDHIFMIQPLRSDSRVLETIAEYKASQK